MNAAARPPLRVIGIGSPAAPDNLGLLLVEQLRGRFDAENVELLALDRPGPALIQHLRDAASVILVDAVQSGATPGTLFDLDAGALDSLLSSPASSHGFGLAETLALAGQLGELPPRIRFIGMETAQDLPLPNNLAALRQAIEAAVMAELE